MATLQEIQSALSPAHQLQAQTGQFAQLVDQINALAVANWTVKQSIGGIVVTLTVSQADQNALIAQYVTAKAGLSATFGLLP